MKLASFFCPFLLSITLLAQSEKDFTSNNQSQPPAIISTCISCHGSEGISGNDAWPNLKGQKKDYLIKQLSNFKNGMRSDPLMNNISKNLSDNDIKILATYFSYLK